MKRPIVVAKDDLIYDGKNIIIPSYWVSTLAEYFHKSQIKPNFNIEECDLIDVDNFKKFLFEVEEVKNRGN